jgi:hypothetical protein
LRVISASSEAFFYPQTMRKSTPIFSFLLLLGGLHLITAQGGQAPSNASVPFREDQFYLGIAYSLGQQAAVDFEQKGFSYQLDTGFLRDIPLVPSGQWAIAPGMGFSFQKFTSNLNAANLATTALEVYDNSKHSFSYGSLLFPVEFRWRNATATNFSFWRMHLGAALALPLWERSASTIALLPKTNTSVYLAVGYNTWNLFVAYQLQPFIKVPGETSPQLPQLLNVGLRFYIL